MARSIWSGALSFGLVNVPVKLYSAVSRKTVRFHQLNEETGNRIAQKRVDAQTGEEVAYESIVKGYELGRDRYVVVRPDELDALDPARTRTIDIEDFVDLDQIDPVYYDHPYYLVPDKGAAKPYGLLLEAMRRSGKVAIARVVLRSKEQLVAIRPSGDVLLMETMIFHDEVVPTGDLDDLPATGDLRASDREVAMAEQLIESLTSDFEPGKYHDEYREKVLGLIERKAEGEEIAVPAEAPAPVAVPDLMAALEASLAAVKGRSSDEPDEAPKPKKAPRKTGKSRAKAKEPAEDAEDEESPAPRTSRARSKAG
jgi:DNA end-binding protein Ku